MIIINLIAGATLVTSVIYGTHYLYNNLKDDNGKVHNNIKAIWQGNYNMKEFYPTIGFMAAVLATGAALCICLPSLGLSPPPANANIVIGTVLAATLGAAAFVYTEIIHPRKVDDNWGDGLPWMMSS